MGTSKRIAWVLTIVVASAGVGLANWADSFDGGQPNLTTWQFLCFPQLTGTFKQPIKTSPDGNPYLALSETSSAGVGGTQFGMGLGSAEEFTDVRVGAVVNVTGDASHNHHGLGARAAYIIDPDGKLTGQAPGAVVSGYVMHINWEDGPANLRIDIEKVAQLQNIMRTNFDVLVPGLAHTRSYYAELDVVGAGPVYVTGSLYEFKGGPLVARTATLVDTVGNDPWEDPDEQDAPFIKGPSGIFAQNEQAEPAGFYTTFDDVFSASDGPAAAATAPVDGATGVSIRAELIWTEAAFATGRQLWFGPKGDMHLITSAPAGTTYDPGGLDFSQTYQWRIDQIGPAGVVEGRTWEFTTGEMIAVEDFESYADTAAVAAAWPDNIPDWDYIYLDTSTVSQGAKAMCFRYQNQVDPFFTETTRIFATPQNWTIRNRTSFLSLSFRGTDDNVPQPMYVRIEDAAGNEATVAHRVDYAVQTNYWRVWDIPLTDLAGVDRTAVMKLTIGTGSGTDSGQGSADEDMLYIDNICLSFFQPTVER